MIRNRTFMMGLGIGLVLGAILLQLMIIGKGKQAQDEAATELTKEQLIAAAEAMNLQVVERPGDEGAEREQGEEDAAVSTSDEEAQGEAPVSPPEPEQPKTPQQPEQPDQVQAESTQADEQVSAPTEPEPPVQEPIKLVVPEGSYLSDVAEALTKAGIIDDKEGFIARATSRKINRKIQTGTYSFKPGEDFDTIITLLTKPSN